MTGESVKARGTHRRCSDAIPPSTLPPPNHLLKYVILCRGSENFGFFYKTPISLENLNSSCKLYSHVETDLFAYGKGYTDGVGRRPLLRGYKVPTLHCHHYVHHSGGKQTTKTQKNHTLL